MNYRLVTTLVSDLQFGRELLRCRLELDDVADPDVEDLAGVAAVDGDRHPAGRILVEEEAAVGNLLEGGGAGGGPAALARADRDPARAGERVAVEVGAAEVERDVPEPVDPLGMGEGAQLLEPGPRDGLPLEGRGVDRHPGVGQGVAPGEVGGDRSEEVATVEGGRRVLEAERQSR